MYSLCNYFSWILCLLDLSMHPVQSVADCEKLMYQGWKNRATGATLMNADSSRSHSIFSINLEMMPLCALEDACCPADGDHIRRGKLNLVDLAGSERQAKTGNKKFPNLTYDTPRIQNSSTRLGQRIDDWTDKYIAISVE